MSEQKNNPVVIERNLLGVIESFFQQRLYSKVFLLVDEHTKAQCHPLIKEFLPKHICIEIKSGEEEKNLSTCTHIWHELTLHEADRKSLLLNLGGGVIGDMGAFCAATYKRGIDFVQIPTTLLAQVDASVGGKTGIDFEGFKNHIGVFCMPKAVWISTQFLKTLDPREVRSGFAEIIKHCLIADKGQWKSLKEIRIEEMTDIQWEIWVRHSVSIKESIVSEDPTEKGPRKLLNFGHTIGHAIESCYLEIPGQRLLHGEAIALGMVCEAFISMKKGLLFLEEFKEIREVILRFYPEIKIKKHFIEQIVSLTSQDKKNESGIILMVLLNQIGHAVYDQAVSKEEIGESLQSAPSF